MRSLQAAALCVVAACLGFAWPAAAAGKYDGSAPMLCAVTAVSECTADGKCERSAPQAGNNLPTFMRVDVKGRILRADDDSGRKTRSRPRAWSTASSCSRALRTARPGTW